MRVAIIHYWLVQMRGGERVLEHLCDMYPDADIFTHVVNRAKLSPKLAARRIHTSWISRLPFATRHYQKYLPLMPAALEALDLSAYDLVISCEAGPAKGIITRPDAVHVTYCHSPMRYIWDQYHQYRRESGMGARLMMPLFAPALRQWDMASAARSDRILANSAYVAARVRKFWGREAQVVHPPVDTALFAPADEVGEDYLWAGQLIPYKLPDVAVAAFTASGRRLHVVGTGPMLPRLKAMAGPSIRFTERLDFNALRAAYAGCKALIFTAEEDFGMIPVEVMASGRPVIAYGRGGALESVIEDRTGLFYHDNSPDGLLDALDRFEDWLPDFDPSDALSRAADFAPARFRAAIASHIDAALTRHEAKPAPWQALAPAMALQNQPALT
ncbi:glycosyltransferase [Novosphingobium terrae]|uniref:glycosyltransferase n=1 Tax=Novosphingobium terrae TaxID=2726189 RepID=UPI00197DBCC5|nr:glycosyltransferase [Novosphingobium terrae]